MVAHNRESPHEGQTVGMQLGRGHVNFCQQRLLKAGEGEAQLYTFEDSLVEEEEGLPLVSPVINTYGFALSTGSN